MGARFCGRTPTIAALSSDVCPPTSRRGMDSDVPQSATPAPPERGHPSPWAESSTNPQHQRGRCRLALLACKRWVDGLAWHERALGVVADRMRYSHDALGVSQATVYRVLAEQTAESD